jgi:geranylgeranyl reductase family protein
VTSYDAVVVGGGPAGSSCAHTLHDAGWNVAVVDRAQFPRDKVCAGWLTAEVFPLLGLTPGDYRASGATLQEITGFRTRVIGRRPIETRYPRTISYAIRRCEFDAFLLRRSGARVFGRTPVSSLRRRGERWVINDEFETPVVVGAGGHFCPVARHLRGGRDSSLPVVAKEAEFRLDGDTPALAGDVPELLFCHDLQGYAWCVRKEGYVNVGIGRRGNRDFSRHVQAFVELLDRTMNIRTPESAQWRGHAYLAGGAGPRPLAGEGMVLAGDAAGLAYPESGEGIRPAIESGQMAAAAIIRAGGRYSADALRPYAAAIKSRYPPRTPGCGVSATVSAALGRMLLRSSIFTRHVVIDRWFLRTAGGMPAGLPRLLPH